MFLCSSDCDNLLGKKYCCFCYVSLLIFKEFLQKNVSGTCGSNLEESSFISVWEAAIVLQLREVESVGKRSHKKQLNCTLVRCTDAVAKSGKRIAEPVIVKIM